MSLKEYCCHLDYAKKSQTPRTLRDMARHMAMTDDQPHRDWLKRHGLPDKMGDDMRIVNEKLHDVEQAILQDKADFSCRTF
jgi:hypothetical protein